MKGLDCWPSMNRSMGKRPKIAASDRSDSIKVEPYVKAEARNKLLETAEGFLQPGKDGNVGQDSSGSPPESLQLPLGMLIRPQNKAQVSQRQPSTRPRRLTGNCSDSGVSKKVAQSELQCNHILPIRHRVSSRSLLKSIKAAGERKNERFSINRQGGHLCPAGASQELVYLDF